MCKINLLINLNKLNPETFPILLEELEKKGFFSNGIISCTEEQGKEVMQILDKYLYAKEKD
jgi:hypothetical protein